MFIAKERDRDRMMRFPGDRCLNPNAGLDMRHQKTNCRYTVHVPVAAMGAENQGAGRKLFLQRRFLMTGVRRYNLTPLKNLEVRNEINRPEAFPI
jgi:hypothetical protein